MPKKDNGIRSRKLNYLINSEFEGKQRVFCEKTGIAQSLVSRYLHGKIIGDDMAEKIELACGLEPGWLDDSANLPPVAERRKSLDTGETELYRLIGLITNLSEKERRRIRKIYEAITASRDDDNNNSTEQ
ncbi:helix-turn-helix transcriptional regulator [Nitrosomonas sp.]|uniref:helix-turn-helix domain-containing protein n=1 Tax=Nitrosomonas sp. TaxID=42353 RepID=UPI0025FC866A|nr:helix-turn-helix transcriptional regulator [Nitrosomonas sp.]MBY0484596.1 helix-turn-helix domain-containing protein [Nitrosomonas sp.]